MSPASVEVQELSTQEKPVFTATTKSLSIGGIQLDSEKPLEAGAKIQIHIAFNRQNPLLVIGTVVRSVKTDTGSHDISIAFIGTDKVIKNEITSFLIKHLDDSTAPPLKSIQLLT